MQQLFETKGNVANSLTYRRPQCVQK